MRMDGWCCAASRAPSKCRHPGRSSSMGFFKKLIDVFTLGSDHPIRRLLGYYVILGAVVVALAYAFPTVNRMLGSAAPAAGADQAVLPDRLTLAVSTLSLILATLALILPVSWVYMSTQRSKGHD